MENFLNTTSSDNGDMHNQAVSPKKLITATVLAFIVAMAVLFSAILPAEYGTDPLGTGKLFGLNILSKDIPIESQLQAHRSDYVEFILGPFQSTEYKYLLDLDAPMIFSWTADGELYYDMHAEPAGLGEEFAESFEQGTASAAMGSYHAPFSGIHGWFWENRGSTTITVRLYSAGFYINSTVFRDGSSFEREITTVFE